MTIELTMLAAVAILTFALIGFQGALVPINQGFGWGLGARDEPRDISALQGRAARTIANQIEGIAVFAPLVLIAHLAGVSTILTIWGAAIYFGARLSFAVLYLAGVPVLRSAAWGVGVVGLGLIGFEILRAIFA